MKKIYFLLFLGLPLLLQAQEPPKSALKPCGAPVGIDPFLIEYAKHPENFAADAFDTLKVGLQIHLVAKNDGSGRFTPERLLQAFCRLNADYAASGIRFYFKNPWNLIDNTGWFQHDSITQGIDMMLTNNFPDALNVYFVNDPAGNCGYNLPYAGVAMAHTCSGANDHTWAHEIGHALSLPHPFIGWEGKTYNFNTPTPLTLTYDYTHFHDTLDTQVPAPLDTAKVEFLDGSNCAEAADRLCDTKPDYLSYRWNCDANNNSLVKQKDPSGAEFYSDGTLYMSYASDQCQNRFSEEQIVRMRANLIAKKASWLTTATPEGDITETVQGLSPLNDELVSPSGVTLRWSSVPNAKYYLVTVSRLVGFQFRDFETITTDTTVTTTALLANKKFYWRVRPFNDWFACANLSEAETFMTTQASAVASPDAEGWACYPNPLGNGQTLRLEFPVKWQQQEVSFTFTDLAGRTLESGQFFAVSGKNNVLLHKAGENAGMYQLLLRSNIGVKSIPVVISK
jgi:hypothetical protein